MVDVSVIVPVYNAIKFIDPLFKALQQQTFTNVEFLIVDDGSKDGTTALLKQKADELQDDLRFKILFKANGGVSSARNYAIDHVKGAYIIFMDADDTPLPNMVAAYYQRIQTTGNDFEFFEAKKVDDQGTVMGRLGYLSSQYGNTYSRNELFEKMGELQMFGYPFLFISKATLWNRNSFDESIKYQEDLLALGKLFSKHPEIKGGFNQASYYLYLQNPASALHTMPVSGYIDFVNVADLIIEIARNSGVPEQTMQKLNGIKISSVVAVLAIAALKNDKQLFEEYRTIYLPVYKDTIFSEPKVRLRKAIQYFATKYRIKFILKVAYKQFFDI